MKRKNTLPVDVEKIEQLRRTRHLSLERLAHKADIHPKTLTRILNKQTEPRLDTIESLANALGVAPEVFREDVNIQPEKTQFQLNISLEGVTYSSQNLGVLVTLTPSIIALLKANDIQVTAAQTQIDQIQGDSLRRVVAIVYRVTSMFEVDGIPFWSFVAVRPNKYAEFDAACKDHTLILSEFDAFGEVIATAMTPYPLDANVEKLADMYHANQADRIQMFEVLKKCASRMRTLLAEAGTVFDDYPGTKEQQAQTAQSCGPFWGSLPE